MTHPDTTQSCPYSPHSGPVGCLPAPNIFPLAKETFAKGKMFWNIRYSCVPPSRLAAGRAGGMRNNIFMFRVKIRSLRRSFQFDEFLPLFPNRPSCLRDILTLAALLRPLVLRDLRSLIGLTALIRPFGSKGPLVPHRPNSLIKTLRV